MAPAAGILSVKVLPDNGPGDVFTLVKGIIAAVDRGARVVNLSLGTRGDSFLLKEAIGYAAGKGVIVVAAAGNDGSAASLYPAAYDGVVAVTAVDTEGNRAFFSNTGNASSISAPGMGLLAAAPGDKAGLFSGTSAAAPLVSGAAAMVLSRDQGLSASEVMDLLRRCSADAGMPGRDAEYGSGILNMDRLSRWQERGVIDVAAGRPQVEFPRAGTGDMVVHVYAQNRGTEVLPQVTLELVINQSARHVWSFRDVGVGQTVSEILRTEMSAWKNIGDLPIRVTATSVNLRDVNPANNTVSVSIVTAK
jgi:subtilisin family serine protease